MSRFDVLVNRNPNAYEFCDPHRFVKFVVGQTEIEATVKDFYRDQEGVRCYVLQDTTGDIWRGVPESEISYID